MRSRAAAVVLATSLLTSAGWLLPVPATAAKACVGVIVDARLAGGGVSTGCALGDPDSGLDALVDAGYSYAFAPRYPGLVCSINGTPECAKMTTTDYWSYWYREPGSPTWVYSSQGAGAHDPEPGSTEAWVWQEGGRQQPPDIALVTICPQAAEPPSPAPSRTKKPSRTNTPEPTATTDRTEGKRSAAEKSPETSRESGPVASPTAASTSPTDAASGAADSTGPSPAASLSAQPAAALRESDSDDGSSLTGPLAGAALVALLAGAAVWRSRRPTDRS
jgi:hypothetical protein